jgi:hypothetical protein
MTIGLRARGGRWRLAFSAAGCLARLDGKLNWPRATSVETMITFEGSGECLASAAS